MDLNRLLKTARRLVKGASGGAPRSEGPQARSIELPPLDSDGNRIRVDDTLSEGRDFFLTVTGQGNRLDIARPTSVGRLVVTLDGGGHVAIGPGCVCEDLFIHAGRGARIEIGARVGFNGRTRLLAHEPFAIEIGDDCLFAGNIDVSVSDMHPIFDAATGRRLNLGRAIRIGRQVWIGQNAMILKGVTLGDGAIVGAMSVVTRDVPGGCVAAGNPARVVRKRVTWAYEMEPSAEIAAPEAASPPGEAADAPGGDGLRHRIVDMAAMAKRAREGGHPMREVVRLRSVMVELPRMPAAAAVLKSLDIRETEQHITWRQELYASAEAPVFAIADAIVHTSAGIVGVDGAIISETLWHTHPNVHRYARDGDAITLPSSGLETLEGAHVSLLCGSSENYFQAVIESAARISLVPEALLETARGVLVPEEGTAQADLLAIYGLPPGVTARRVSRSETFRVEELLLPWSLHGVFSFHPRLDAFFERIRRRAPRPDEPRAKRIYVDLRGSPLRPLANEEAVIAALEPLGFEPVRLETLSAGEQVALFRDAEAIVAPHGLGLTNLGFIDHDCVVIELMMDAYVNWSFRRIAALRHAQYDCVFGQASKPWAKLDEAFNAQSWEVSVEDTVRTVREALKRRGLRERALNAVAAPSAGAADGAGGLRLRVVDLASMAGRADDALREILRLDGVTVALPPMPALADALRSVEIREPEPQITWGQTSYESVAAPVYAVTGAVVHGSAGIVGVGGEAISETLWHTRPDVHRYAREGDALVIPIRAIEPLEGRHVSLLCGSSDNYFHTTVESVARLSLVPDALLASARGVLVPEDGIAVRELLDIHGLPEGVAVRPVSRFETFRVEELILPWSLHGVFHFHPRLDAFFERIRGNVPRAEGERGKRVYVDRRKSPLRRLVNEDAVVAALEPLGFEPVRLETLSVREQVALFRGAEAVVSPHGAGLTNLGFVDPGCVVVELMMDAYANWCFRRIAALRRAQYDCVVGRAFAPWAKLDPQFHSQEWQVSVDDMVATVRASLARGGVRERA